MNPIDGTRPLKPVLVDFTEFNAGTAKARRAYDELMADLEPTDPHILANRRYRARKAER